MHLAKILQVAESDRRLNWTLGTDTRKLWGTEVTLENKRVIKLWGTEVTSENKRGFVR